MNSVKFNKKIYPLNAIKAAIKSYKNLAKFTFKQDKKYLQVILGGVTDEDLKPIIKDEFCNYVLSLIKID